MKTLKRSSIQIASASGISIVLKVWVCDIRLSMNRKKGIALSSAD
jgi:hypothetical protein